jgi:FkbM family methyltransferase
MTQPAPESSPAENPKPLLRDAIGNIPNIEILDIGAMPEGVNRYDQLIQQELATVTGFEPNLAQLKILEDLKRPRRRYLPYVLGTGEPATFHVTRYPGCCSLFEPDPNVIDLFADMDAQPPDGNFAVLKTVPTNTRRLDDVPALPPVDFLKADIQGGELDVLRHGTRVISNAVVLEIEVEFLPLYKNQPLFGDIQVFLRDHHFVLHKFLDIAGRAIRPLMLERNPNEPISQVLWADAIFVRDYTDISLWTDEQLLKAAAILYDVYCSHDLVYYLLSALDLRTGSDYVRRFTKALGKMMPHLPLMYMTPKR